jgi:acyl transferase domain-containing protein
MDSTGPLFEPIAVTGFSFKMPQDAVDETGLWKVLEEGRNVMTEWPASRTNVDSLIDDGTKKPNTLPSRGAHFLAEDPGAFDAPFFSITAKEASSMDPQQRQALEVSYHTFENAGIPVHELRGSRTAVYGASMQSDWLMMGAKDPDTVPRMNITGNAASLLPNKISWFFDLRGPSIHVDTACSSGMSALDMACQTILCGNADAALVVGSSVLLSPETSLYLANLNFLSPQSRSFSFDSRGDGYGRGEGMAALFLKPLKRAVRDGDIVRAVVRATASNQDGRTPGLTQPSSEAQEALIRTAYAKAGLSMDKTRYVEAHGTGTPTGDPIEARAIGNAFGRMRSPDQPLYLGSIKANIGHLEGSSGPAGVIKSIMMLEKGIIPPQALFENLNPAIDAKGNNLKIPTAKTPWPQSGLRRISVNSFGFGGANSHAILDDAMHFMQEHNVEGFHHCVDRPDTADMTLVNGLTDSTAVGVEVTDGEKASAASPALLVWSASDQAATHRMLRRYDDYYFSHIAGDGRKLGQLAYTLSARRSIMPWRTFSIVDGSETVSQASDDQLSLRTEKPVRVSSDKAGIAYIFTGQGAQYAAMGQALLQYPVFEQSLKVTDQLFKDMGCEWSLFGRSQQSKVFSLCEDVH